MGSYKDLYDTLKVFIILLDQWKKKLVFVDQSENRTATLYFIPNLKHILI